MGYSSTSSGKTSQQWSFNLCTVLSLSSCPADRRYLLYWGVPRTAAHADLAKLFVNMAMSKEGQKIVYKTYATDHYELPGSVVGGGAASVPGELRSYERSAEAKTCVTNATPQRSLPPLLSQRSFQNSNNCGIISLATFGFVKLCSFPKICSAKGRNSLRTRSR